MIMSKLFKKSLNTGTLHNSWLAIKSKTKAEAGVSLMEFVRMDIITIFTPNYAINIAKECLSLSVLIINHY